MNIKDLTKGKLTVRDVADLCGISVQAVYKWDEVPCEYVLLICAKADWIVTPHKLRDDIYPHPHDGLPRELCDCQSLKEAA